MGAKKARRDCRDKLSGCVFVHSILKTIEIVLEGYVSRVKINAPTADQISKCDLSSFSLKRLKTLTKA